MSPNEEGSRGLDAELVAFENYIRGFAVVLGEMGLYGLLEVALPRFGVGAHPELVLAIFLQSFHVKSVAIFMCKVKPFYNLLFSRTDVACFYCSFSIYIINMFILIIKNFLNLFEYTIFVRKKPYAYIFQFSNKEKYNSLKIFSFLNCQK